MNTLAPAPSPPADEAPDRLYQLQTPGSLKPAVMLGLGLPANVNGIPAFYYWKDAILVGAYRHPTGRFSLSMTPQKLDRLVTTFGRMRRNGVQVPILMDHAPTAAATLGWIVDVKRRGERLMELHQFLGEAARDVGLRNQVSLGIDPAFVDGRGEAYGEAIVHSAITPLPVVPGQQGFEPVEAAEPSAEFETSKSPAGESATIDTPLTLSLVDAPIESSTVADEVVSTVADTAPPLPPSTTPQAAAAAAVELPPGATPAIEPPLPSNARSVALARAVARRDAVVSRGCLSPAAADELLALLSGASASSPLLLSSAAEVSDLASAVFDTLARHRPPPLGERTTVQLLTRIVPGQDDDRLELRDRMIALASGR